MKKTYKIRVYILPPKHDGYPKEDFYTHVEADKSQITRRPPDKMGHSAIHVTGTPVDGRDWKLRDIDFFLPEKQVTIDQTPLIVHRIINSGL